MCVSNLGSTASNHMNGWMDGWMDGWMVDGDGWWLVVGRGFLNSIRIIIREYSSILLF